MIWRPWLRLRPTEADLEKAAALAELPPPGLAI
jgi:hypothetical protein